MTVIIACNTPKGVILGADGAAILTFADNNIPSQVCKDVQKIFPFGEKSIGIAIYGNYYMGDKTADTYLRKYIRDEGMYTLGLNGKVKIGDIAEKLRSYFSYLYKKHIGATSYKNATSQLEEAKYVFGMVIAGFSDDAEQSEVWHFRFPEDLDTNNAEIVNKQGSFFATFYAMYKPIFGYQFGVSEDLFSSFIEYLLKNFDLKSNKLTRIIEILDENTSKAKIMNIENANTTIDDGIEYTKFLVELAAARYKYYEDASDIPVGGKVSIGIVEANGMPFKILNIKN